MIWHDMIDVFIIFEIQYLRFCMWEDTNVFVVLLINIHVLYYCIKFRKYAIVYTYIVSKYNIYLYDKKKSESLANFLKLFLGEYK